MQFVLNSGFTPRGPFKYNVRNYIFIMIGTFPSKKESSVSQPIKRFIFLINIGFLSLVFFKIVSILEVRLKTTKVGFS